MERLVAGEKRLLQHGGDGVAEGGAKDQQYAHADLDIEPLAERDHADAGEGQRGTEPGGQAETLAEDHHGEHGGHDRVGVDDEGGRARRHDALAEIQEQRIASDEDHAADEEAPDIAGLG